MKNGSVDDMKQNRFRIRCISFFMIVLLIGMIDYRQSDTFPVNTEIHSEINIPLYSGTPFAVINDNVPLFTQQEETQEAFETYSELDALGRCGVAFANICPDIMPTEERGKIGNIRPSGWHSVRYDCVDGAYLYNRCHLIGYQLAGENANEKNLITGTRYLNVEGMLPFENRVMEYVRETGNHVLYRVTPLFEGEELLARGVYMEARSVEDHGAGIQFFVFCYNVQPGIEICYSDGESQLKVEADTEMMGEENKKEEVNCIYVLNIHTKKYHRPECDSVSEIKPKNRLVYEGEADDLIREGYTACGRCKP